MEELVGADCEVPTVAAADRPNYDEARREQMFLDGKR